MKVKKLRFETVKKIAGDEFNIILHNKPNFTYYGLIDEESNEIITMVGLEDKGRILKFHSGFTPVEYRKRGYSYRLRKVLIEANPDKIFTSEANDWSVGVLKRLGFKVTSERKCKYWTKYFMRKEAINGKTKN